MEFMEVRNLLMIYLLIYVAISKSGSKRFGIPTSSSQPNMGNSQVEYDVGAK